MFEYLFSFTTFDCTNAICDLFVTEHLWYSTNLYIFNGVDCWYLIIYFDNQNTQVLFTFVKLFCYICIKLKANSYFCEKSSCNIFNIVQILVTLLMVWTVGTWWDILMIKILKCYIECFGYICIKLKVNYIFFFLWKSLCVTNIILQVITYLPRQIVSLIIVFNWYC